MSGTTGGTHERRLLFLGQVLPHPPDGGVRIRAYHVFRLLAKEYAVDALCFYRRSTRDGDESLRRSLAALERHAHSVEAFAIPQEGSRLRFVRDHLRSVLARRPYTVYAYDSSGFRTALRQRLTSTSYELAHVDSLDLSGYLPELEGLPVVCAHHNVESELLRRRAESTDFLPAKVYLRLQARFLAQEEETWCRRVRLNVAVSERDRRVLERRIPGLSCRVVPNGVDVETFRPPDPETEDSQAGLVFVGGCTWFPNRDALEYFADDILPRIRREHPDLVVRWVGRATEEVRGHFRDRYDIAMTGYVEDIRPYVHSAACYIVPLRVGGGSRLKILDAWAMQKAIVSTSQGCEGLAAEDGRNILVRDTPDSFASAVCRVLRDEDLRRRLGREGRRTAEERYSWQVIGERMRGIYRGLTRSGEEQSRPSGPPAP